jgi:hypothetical protein
LKSLTVQYNASKIRGLFFKKFLKIIFQPQKGDYFSIIPIEIFSAAKIKGDEKN